MQSQKCLLKERQEFQRQRGQLEDGSRERESLRCYAAGLEDGGRGHESRQFLEAGKGKEADSPLEPAERTQPCRHFDFSS